MAFTDGYYFVRLRKDVLIKPKEQGETGYILPKNSIQLAAVARMKSDSIATPMLGAIIRNPANLLGPTSPTLVLVGTRAKGSAVDDFEIIRAVPTNAESRAIVLYDSP